MIAGALAYCTCWLSLLLGLPMSSAASQTLFFVMGLLATLFIRETYCRYADAG